MRRESRDTADAQEFSSGRTGLPSETTSAQRAGRLSRTDERRALRALGEPRHGRRYRCTSCGLAYAVDELTPDVDDAGNRVGWTCEHCW